MALASACGRRVTTIKHTHHEGPFIPRGGDSGRLLRAGAIESILASRSGAILESCGTAASWHAPEDLLALVPPPTDLVLMEGFRSWRAARRIAVVRAPDGELPADCVAVVSNESLPTALPRFTFAQLAELLSFLDTIGRE